MPSSTQEPIQKPQSIVHKLGRMGSKITNPLRKQVTGKRQNSQNRRKCATKDMMIPSSVTTEDTNYDSPDEWLATPYCYDDSVQQNALHEDTESSEFFIPLDQNQFFVECFMTNECSDASFIVLFCAGKCSLSEQIEDVVLIRTMEAGSNCQCRRVDSRQAPLFTAKLQIDPTNQRLWRSRTGRWSENSQTFRHLDVGSLSNGCLIPKF